MIFYINERICSVSSYYFHQLIFDLKTCASKVTILLTWIASRKKGSYCTTQSTLHETYNLPKWRPVDDSFSKQNFTCLLIAIKQLLHQGKQIINTTCKMTPRTKLVVQTRWNRRCHIIGEKNRQTGHWLVSLAEVQF